MAVPAQVYGFSVHIWNKPFVFKLIRMLRKLRPQAAIVIGGPEVAFDAERIFAELPQADYIVQGESWYSASCCSIWLAVALSLSILRIAKGSR